MLKLKRNELLDLKGLRKLCRLRNYDVLAVNKKYVTLNCVHHGAWEDKQLKVLADSAECPACGKTRPFGKWSFAREDWAATVHRIVPSIKLIDKSLVIEGRTLHKYRCKKCKAKFKNSLSAILHPKFRCPNCNYQPSDKQIRASRTALLNLKSRVDKDHKDRDLQFYMQDMKAAYETLRALGTVKYPPQIDIPPAIRKPRPKAEYLDLDDLMVKELDVRIVDQPQEGATLSLQEDDVLVLQEESEDVVEQSAGVVEQNFVSRQAPTVAVYAGRGGQRPMNPTVQQLRDTYGNFISN